MIPQSFIQELLNRVDIVEVIGRFLCLKKKGTNLTGLCPFHQEKTPSFTVSPGKQFYHCFGCGVHGTAISFLIEYRGLGFIEAVTELAQSAGLTVPQSAPSVPHADSQKEQRSLLEAMIQACDFYQQQLRITQGAQTYLQKRGLTDDMIVKFGLGYAPTAWDSLRQVFPDYQESKILLGAGLVIDKAAGNQTRRKRYDRFRDRIIFPIRNTKAQIVGFGGRVLGDDTPKYLNSPETPLFQKGYELYGLFEARQAIHQAGYVLVTEGYLDVITLAQFGFPHTVATLGTACTAVHVQKLLRQSDQIIFSFDSDAAGQRAARRALEACLPYAVDNKLIRFLFLPTPYDPDSYVRELGPQAFSQQIQDAMPLSQFLLREAVGNHDLTTPEGRAQAQFNAKPLLQTLPSSSLRLQIMNSLARMTESTTADIENLFALNKPTAQRIARAHHVSPKSALSAPVKLEQRMLQLLLMHPTLASDLDEATLKTIEYVAPEQASMLRHIIDVIHHIGQQVNFAGLIEPLRAAGPSMTRLIAETAKQTELDRETTRLEMAGTIRQIKIRAIEDQIQQLVAQGLKDELTRTQYRNLMQQKKCLKLNVAL